MFMFGTDHGCFTDHPDELRKARVVISELYGDAIDHEG
jgi:hypothetical protein